MIPSTETTGNRMIPLEEDSHQREEEMTSEEVDLQLEGSRMTLSTEVDHQAEEVTINEVSTKTINVATTKDSRTKATTKEAEIHPHRKEETPTTIP